MRRFCCKTYNFFLLSATTFRNLQKPSSLQDKVDSWVVKRAKSLFNSFCTNVVNQVASCCCPFYRTFNTNYILFFIHSFIHSLFAIYTKLFLRKIGMIWDKRKSKVNNHHQQLKPTLKVPQSPSSPKIVLLYNCYWKTQKTINTRVVLERIGKVKAYQV